VSVRKTGVRSRPHAGWRLAFGSGRGQARGFLRFWPVWEFVATHTYLRHIRPIPGAPHTIFRLRLARFGGRPMTLPGGAVICKGDQVGELHLHSEVVGEMMRTQGQWALMQAMKEDLAALARWVRDDEELADLRAIWGITLLSRGAPRLGFILRERPRNLYTILEHFFLQGLLVIYNPDGVKRLSHGATHRDAPQEIWMSRDALLQRYLP
jgi:hypothetical protein